MKRLKIELFQKLTATFPLYLSIRILTKMRKLKIFPWNNLVRKKRISVETWMKKLTRVFLEKSELQLLKLNTVCAFPQYEKSKDIFQKNYIQTNFAFSDPGDSSIEKKKLKKGQLLTIIFRKINRSMISTFKEDQKLPTSVTLESCIIKDTNDSADLNSEASWAVPGKKTTTTELNFFFSKFFSTENINDR